MSDYRVCSNLKVEVDHIIPIRGKNVCGLHCEDNLQLMTKPANCAKNNRLHVGG